MTKSKIGVLGSGPVGEALANGFLEHGHDVMRGSREPGKLADWKSKAGAHASVGTFDETARFGDIVVLAVKGTVAHEVLTLAGTETLAGKVVIDTTNPLANEPPEDGVLRVFTGPNESLMERLQEHAPQARLVKCFSCVGNPFMVNPDFGGEKPTMFICGNDEAAKSDVKAILDVFGWDTEDMGTAKAARAIEPLCVLWCITGLRTKKWSHAYRMLRK